MSSIRVLHVFGVLSRTGGAEKWILDLLSRRDSRVQFDFLISADDGAAVQEVRRLGAAVHWVPFSRSPLPCDWGNPYLAGVRNILKKNQYDAVHVHQFDLSGEILRIAFQERVAGRVMSVHAAEYENLRFYRRFVHSHFGRPWLFRYATHILPCSWAVQQSLAVSDPKIQILYTGTDPTLFEKAAYRREERGVRLRKELNLPNNATILGHIGRFTRQKNHLFLLELLEYLFRSNDSFYAVLVGDGERREQIRGVIQRKHLQDRIILTGLRQDVPDLFCSLFDVFLLPSLYEGLPISAVEALASGLGVVYSDRISRELDDFFPQRLRRVALDVSKKHWEKAIREMIAARCETASAIKELTATPLTLQNSLEHLIAIYRQTAKNVESNEKK
jgi:glycosyltransferase involved in cell wall biosynthesis